MPPWIFCGFITFSAFLWKLPKLQHVHRLVLDIVFKSFLASYCFLDHARHLRRGYSIKSSTSLWLYQWHIFAYVLNLFDDVGNVQNVQEFPGTTFLRFGCLFEFCSQGVNRKSIQIGGSDKETHSFSLEANLGYFQRVPKIATGTGIQDKLFFCSGFKCTMTAAIWSRNLRQTFCSGFKYLMTNMNPAQTFCTGLLYLMTAVYIISDIPIQPFSRFLTL